MSITEAAVQPSTDSKTPKIRIRVGFDVTYESEYETPLFMVVRPRDSMYHTMLAEHRVVTPNIPVDEYIDSFGNTIWRMVTPVGTLRVKHDVLVETPDRPDPLHPGLPRTPVAELPSDTIMYTLPSRYCESDKLISTAWDLFGDIPTGWEQVQAVCDWIHTNIVYGKGSNSQTTAYDIYQAGRGVCRDFAHLGVALCRALNIPARYVCGYLPEIRVVPDPAPMDFHAWFEVFLDGQWHAFDARHNRQRFGRVLIATGRDAVDVAWATAFGSARLATMRVWADEVGPEVTLEK